MLHTSNGNVSLLTTFATNSVLSLLKYVQLTEIHFPCLEPLLLLSILLWTVLLVPVLFISDFVNMVCREEDWHKHQSSLLVMAGINWNLLIQINMHTQQYISITSLLHLSIPTFFHWVHSQTWRSGTIWSNARPKTSVEVCDTKYVHRIWSQIYRIRIQIQFHLVWFWFWFDLLSNLKLKRNVFVNAVSEIRIHRTHIRLVQFFVNPRNWNQNPDRSRTNRTVTF